jgi:hypothetical protein
MWIKNSAVMAREKFNLRSRLRSRKFGNALAESKL